MHKSKTSDFFPLFDSLEFFEREPKVVNYFSNDPQKESDYQLAHRFLYHYRGSSATFNAYRREVERLLHWCWSIANKTLIALLREDIEAYIEFCKNPPAHWIGTQNYTRFIQQDAQRTPNPLWRPFTAKVSKHAYKQGKLPSAKNYLLSQKAIQAIFSVCSSFFNYLIEENYIKVNPVLSIRQKSKFVQTQQNNQIIRRLTELQWAYVIETTELAAKENAEKFERSLFMLNALYGMYLRISELAESPRWQPQMGHFYKDIEHNWWFKTVGKGNKQRIISVSDAMLTALKRYRKHLGLTLLPTAGEITPLLMNQKDKGAIKNTRTIRREVQTCFDMAIARLEKDGLLEEAEQLNAATVHWLRHTGISDDVKIRPREHVRDDAGHGSSAITDKYIDIELRERHASAKNKTIKPVWLNDIPETENNHD